jgi:hypothetical protein
MSYHLLQATEFRNRLVRHVDDPAPTWLTFHELDLLLSHVYRAMPSLRSEAQLQLAIGSADGTELAALIEEIARLYGAAVVALAMGDKHPAV